MLEVGSESLDACCTSGEAALSFGHELKTLKHVTFDLQPAQQIVIKSCTHGNSDP